MVNNDINYMRKELDRVQVKMSDFSVRTEYAQSTSDSTPPTTGWSEDKPSAEEGKFIWTRNIMNMGYGDVITEPVCIGDGLEHITSLDVEYISWADPYQAPPQSESGWQTTAPSLTYGHYIWTRTKIITTEQTTYTDPVRVTGELNEELATGNGYLTGNNNYIHIVYSDVNNPTSWNQCFRYPSNHRYVGVLVNNSDDYVTTPSSYTWSEYNSTNGYNVGNNKYFHVKYSNNEDGYDADDNVDMNDKGGLFVGYCTDSNLADPSTPSSYTWIRLEGKGILEIVEYYAESNSYSTQPTSGWSTTPVPFREGYFYWTKSIINYTDGTSVETTPLCVSGVDGSDVWYVYYVTNTLSTPTTPTQSDIHHTIPSNPYDKWLDDPYPIDANHKYIYISSANSVYNSSGEKVWSSFSTPSLWSRYAVDGSNGTGYEYAYYTSDSSSTPSAPSGNVPSVNTRNVWSSLPVAMTSVYKYMYISYRTVQGSTKSAWSSPALWSQFGDKGDAGARGSDGSGLEHIFYRSSLEITNWGTERFVDSGVSGSANTDYYVARATKTVGSDGTTLTATSNSGIAIFQSVSTEFNLNITIEFDLVSSCSSAKIQIYESSTTTEQYINISESGHYVINIASNTIHGTCNGVPIDVPSTYPSTSARLGFLILTSGQSIKFKNLKVYDTWGYRNPHVWRVQPDTPDYFIKESGWTDDAQGVDNEHPYEYCSIRTKKPDSNGVAKWGIFDTPSLWSKWGVDGQSVNPTELVEATKEAIDWENINATTLNEEYSASDFIKMKPQEELHEQTNGGVIECKKLGLLVVITVYNWNVRNLGGSYSGYEPFRMNSDSTGSTLVEIGAGFRPSREMFVGCGVSGTNTKSVVARLNTNGNLHLTRAGFFSDSTSYTESVSCSFVFFVDTRTSTSITLSNNAPNNSWSNMYVGDSVIATLKQGTTPLVGKTLIFRINNVNYSRVTDNNGQASLPLNIPSGTYSSGVRVDFNGDTTYKPSKETYTDLTLKKATASITVSNSTIYRNDFIKGTILNNNNHPLKGLIVKSVLNYNEYLCATSVEGKFECPHPNDGMKYNGTSQKFNIKLESVNNSYVEVKNQEVWKVFS